MAGYSFCVEIAGDIQDLFIYIIRGRHLEKIDKSVYKGKVGTRTFHVPSSRNVLVELLKAFASS